ncbi:MAG: hypothetical protein AAFP19_06125 [Bacteroidota bacterium]
MPTISHLSLILCVSLTLFAACQSESPSAQPTRPLAKKQATNTSETIKKIPASHAQGPCKADFDLAIHLLREAERMSEDSIPYSAAKGNDCSGIFHQFLNTVKEHCPDAQYPKMSQARDSRAIAQWYHKWGQLQIVEDPDKDSPLIQPGMVLFYGYGQRKTPYTYGQLTIDSLNIRGRGINHVAVVVSVNRNEEGVLESYDIFHGRNPRHPAGITTSQRFRARHPNLPMYGNWKQPWLAAAYLLTP